MAVRSFAKIVEDASGPRGTLLGLLVRRDTANGMSCAGCVFEHDPACLTSEFEEAEQVAFATLCFDDNGARYIKVV